MTAKIFNYNQIEEIKAAGVKYAVTVGRRQPMHKMHADSIKEILREGFFLIYVVGSTNSAYDETGKIDRFFDPIKNPLTFEQEREQLLSVFPQLYDMRKIKQENVNIGPNLVVFPLRDIGNLTIWSKKLCDLLKNEKILSENGVNEKGGILEKSIIHFRGKKKDKKDIRYEVNGSTVTRTDVWDIEALRDFGLAIWFSKNANEEDYKIDSSEFRNVDINSEKARNIIAYNYIISIIKKARQENPDSKILENANIPLTIFDLTLDRMRKEAGISTKDIAAATKDNNLKNFIISARNCLDNRKT